MSPKGCGRVRPEGAPPPIIKYGLRVIEGLMNEDGSTARAKAPWTLTLATAANLRPAAPDAAARKPADAVDAME